ncbi:hypothetical protein N7478_011207 [Penicillium angulare]|uniref:uncharacterized protein n=1 Tax=Penicillium angulare TaxID=116970 RepID=UPI0025414738|nr:uncharacterized protein N7478_011207 [Penicillium angulare]KAJ5263602.1 hypothetical protein N7478_011207 [Penicillium angulare]
MKMVVGIAAIEQAITCMALEIATFRNPINSKFRMPNDEAEQDRMDLAHNIWLLLLKGELDKAPVKNPQRILDLGTGTGIWAIDIAGYISIQPNVLAATNEVNFEESFLELKSSETISVPSNRAGFDFIHARLLSGCVVDWPKFFRNIYDHLKPGAYFEIQESALWTWSEGESMHPGSPLLQYLTALEVASHGAGRYLNVYYKLRDWLIEAGFEDVQQFTYFLPYAPWPKDPHLKELGRYQFAMAQQAVESKLRKLIRDIEVLIDPVITRREAVKASQTKVQEVESNDEATELGSPSIDWLIDVASDRYDLITLFLGMYVATYDTTAEALCHILSDLSENSQLTADLRSEIIEVMGDKGLNRTTLQKLHLMDSFLKESQRMHPVSYVILSSSNVYLFVSWPSKDPENGALILREAVSQTVTALPYLSGNVVLSMKSGGIQNLRQIQPAESSTLCDFPMFMTRYHQQSIKSIDWDDLSREQFIPDRKRSSEIDHVLRFQVNAMKDGLVLCMSFHHSAMDLIGAAGVLASLAAYCRGHPSPNGWKTYTQSRKQIANATTAAFIAAGEDHEASGDMQFFYSWWCAEKKKACPSSDDMVTALIWIWMVRARYSHQLMPAKGDSRLHRAINVRPLLQLLTTKAFMGCAVMAVPCTISRYEIARPRAHPIDDVLLMNDMALKLREAINSFNSERARTQLDNFEKSNNWLNFPLGDADIEFTSWRNSKFYDLDFGPVLGKVDDVEVPNNDWNSTAYILPANPNLASKFANSQGIPPWEIRIVLEPGDMEYLCQKPLLLWACDEEVSSRHHFNHPISRL